MILSTNKNFYTHFFLYRYWYKIDMHRPKNCVWDFSFCMITNELFVLFVRWLWSLLIDWLKLKDEFWYFALALAKHIVKFLSRSALRSACDVLALVQASNCMDTSEKSPPQIIYMWHQHIEYTQIAFHTFYRQPCNGIDLLICITLRECVCMCVRYLLCISFFFFSNATCCRYIFCHSVFIISFYFKAMPFIVWQRGKLPQAKRMESAVLYIHTYQV